MLRVLAEADAFLAGAAAKARAEDPLTAREREVAELVAQALPNREVARARPAWQERRSGPSARTREPAKTER